MLHSPHCALCYTLCYCLLCDTLLRYTLCYGTHSVTVRTLCYGTHSLLRLRTLCYGTHSLLRLRTLSLTVLYVTPSNREHATQRIKTLIPHLSFFHCNANPNLANPNLANLQGLYALKAAFNMYIKKTGLEKVILQSYPYPYPYPYP